MTLEFALQDGDVDHGRAPISISIKGSPGPARACGQALEFKQDTAEAK